MEALAIQMLTVPIVFPIITEVGIDPIHFGIVMLVGLMIGVITPPVGVCLFAVTEIAKTSIAKVSRELVPFYVALVIALLLIAYIPAISLTLPRLMMQ